MLKEKITLEQLNAWNKNTIMEVLHIEFTEVGDTYLCATMPVSHLTHQPMGLLHGGASAVLAETLGSSGSAALTDLTQFNVTGIEINANHIRGKREGTVTGKANLIHHGRSSHIWNIEIRDEEEKLICVSRLTVLIVPKKA